MIAKVKTPELGFTKTVVGEEVRYQVQPSVALRFARFVGYGSFYGLALLVCIGLAAANAKDFGEGVKLALFYFFFPAAVIYAIQYFRHRKNQCVVVTKDSVSNNYQTYLIEHIRDWEIYNAQNLQSHIIESRTEGLAHDTMADASWIIGINYGSEKLSFVTQLSEAQADFLLSDIIKSIQQLRG